MKFSTLNVIIILMILCFSKCSDSFENKKEMNSNLNENSEKNNIDKPKKDLTSADSNSKISKYETKAEENLDIKLDKLSKKEEAIYNHNDKLIDNIKKSNNILK